MGSRFKTGFAFTFINLFLPRQYIRIALNRENTVESIKNSLDSTFGGRVLSELALLYKLLRWLNIAPKTSEGRLLLASDSVLLAGTYFILT